MRNYYPDIFFSFALLLLNACVKPYEPPAIKSTNSFLVVDGVINTAPNAVTTINLTRTRKLTDTINNFPEEGAQIRIESSSGAVFLLQPVSNGVYVSSVLNLDAGSSYRLHISTVDGNTYSSEFVPVTPNPAIDSLNWKQEREDVTVFLTTHNDQNNTRYYRWEYTETWEYHAVYETIYDFRNGQLIFRDTNNYIYKCYSSAPSSNILLHSTSSISQDLIRQQAILELNSKSSKLGVRYSVAVKQYGLTKPAYEYWQIIQKNTQQLGNIFDPQPSQLFGNIKNIKSEMEPVIGYITASPVTEKRLFIRRSEIIE